MHHIHLIEGISSLGDALSLLNYLIYAIHEVLSRHLRGSLLHRLSLWLLLHWLGLWLGILVWRLLYRLLRVRLGWFRMLLLFVLGHVGHLLDLFKLIHLLSNIIFDKLT